MAAWHEHRRSVRWRDMDTWPTWAWLVVLAIEGIVALIGLHFS